MKRYTMNRCLVLLSAIALMVSSVCANEILSNGSFEANMWGWSGAPAGWGVNGYNHVVQATETRSQYVQQGLQSVRMTLNYVGSTVPVLIQTLNVGDANEFVLSGYVREVAGATAAIRVRENKTGAAGSVKYFSGISNAWVKTSVGIAGAGSFFSGDTFGVRMNNTASFTGHANDFHYFSISVPVLEGVSTYALDFASTAYCGTNDASHVWFDNLSVTTVPEPSMMIVLGCCGVACLTRRKR